MFKSPRKSLRKITDPSPRNDRYIHYLTRSIICLGLLSSPLGLLPLLAAPTAPNTSIENQATGSFTDGEDPAALVEGIVSNIVKVTVAEVAGITVGPGVASEAPASVAGAGAFQGDGTINPGDIAYFDYVITNEGNDPTQFFIPGAPSNISPDGTFNAATNPIQIIAYNPGTGSVPVTGVTVPAGGGRTGPTTATGTDGLLGSTANKGIIPPGGTVTIRVPIKVSTTATVGANISATIGKSTALGKNEVYSDSTTNHDLYTQDNVDGTTDANGKVIETAGIPINGNGAPGDGIATNHRQESSNIGSATVIIEPINITGTVFEDVNYGGGAGRDLITSTGIVRPNVRVEIYADDGTYLGATLTDATGKYKFNQFNATTAFAASKSYKIRVVNSFVTSSRTGGCAQAISITTPPATCTQFPVQTFRTFGDTDTNNIADADTNRVGGEVPAKVDAGANTSQNLSTLTVGTTAVESLTTVNLGTKAFSGVDFGYNFDTIVNTNDSGQGSLRQFITNSNELKNTPTDLKQVGQTAGKEVSIFMIPSGIAVAGIQSSILSQLTGGRAVITALTQLPTITDSGTTIDGTTQTTNIGDTNTGSTGTGGTVGTTALALSTVNKPEVEINDGTASIPIGLFVRANNTTVRGLSVWGFGDNSDPAAISGDIVTSATTIAADLTPNCTTTDIFTGLLFEQNILGTDAQGFTATNTSGLTSHNQGKGFFSACGSQGTFQNNLVGFTAGMAAYWSNQQNQDAAMNWQIVNNEFRSGGNRDKIDNVGLESFAHDVTLKGNLITGAYANGVSLYNNYSNGNISIANNTITNSGSGASSTEWAGIAIFTGTGGGVTISQNIINSNKGAGIWVEQDFNGAKITQNSIYNNGGLGIDLKGSTLDNGTGDQTILLNTVTPNDGAKSVANIANLGMDYPIMTAASVSVNAGVSTLTIKGYVGTLANATNNTFSDAKLEFFVSAADTNDKGKVFSTDPNTVSRVHAEGQTYLGTCTADANGRFGTVAKPCSFTVPTGTDPKKLTATATDTLGNTSEFSAAVASDPNVLLVKRITAINGLRQKVGGAPLNTYEDTSSPYDDNNNTLPNAVAPTQKTTSFWPNNASGFILGAVDGGDVAPKNSIEYTIYFLSAGEADAKHVLFCDRVPGNVTFIPNAYNHIPSPTPSSNPNRGIVVQIGTTMNAYDSLDSNYAKYFPPGIEPTGIYPSVNCGGPNTNGAVVVNLDNIPNATGMGVPPESYGFVRFQGLVK